MSNKKWVGIVVLASAAFSTNAMASDRGVNTALGAVLGAVIGNSVGGQNGTVIGGIIGAVAGASLSSHNDRGGRDYRDHRRQSQAVGYGGRSQGYREPTYYRQAPVRSQPRYQDRYQDRYARGHAVQRRDYHNTRRVEYVAYGRDPYRR